MAPLLTKEGWTLLWADGVVLSNETSLTFQRFNSASESAAKAKPTSNDSPENSRL